MSLLNALGAKINGTEYDFSHIEFGIVGLVSVSISEINYSSKLTVGKRRGTSAKPRGRTRGTADFEASFKTYIEDWEKIKAAAVVLALGGGYGEAIFPITVSYRALGLNVPITDTLVGARMIETSRAHSSGENPLEVDVKLDLMDILENGVSIVGDGSGGGVAGAIGGVVGGLL